MDSFKGCKYPLKTHKDIDGRLSEDPQRIFIVRYFYVEKRN
jgi:hypothetical protein